MLRQRYAVKGTQFADKVFDQVARERLNQYGMDFPLWFPGEVRLTSDESKWFPGDLLIWKTGNLEDFEDTEWEEEHGTLMLNGTVRAHPFRPRVTPSGEYIELTFEDIKETKVGEVPTEYSPPEVGYPRVDTAAILELADEIAEDVPED